MPKDMKEPKDASRSRKNTSKTARVLGLLTTPSVDEGAGVEAPPAVPPINKEQFLEDTIRDALEQELNAEPASAPAGRPSRRSLREAEAAADPGAVQPEPQIELSEERLARYEEEFEAIEPMKPEAASEPEEPRYRPMEWPVESASIQPIRPFRSEPAAPAAPEPEPAKENELEVEDQCYNVMQALVEAKMDKFMKMFGLCTCRRCRADVTALSLTHLPPKYVVAKYRNLVPLLPLYEGKYDTDVTAEVIQACKLVLAHPRHNK